MAKGVPLDLHLVGHSGTKLQKSAKNLEFVKLIDLTYVCNSLTHFEYEVNKLTGNGNCMDLLKPAGKCIFGGF